MRLACNVPTVVALANLGGADESRPLWKEEVDGERNERKFLRRAGQGDGREECQYGCRRGWVGPSETTRPASASFIPLGCPGYTRRTARSRRSLRVGPLLCELSLGGLARAEEVSSESRPVNSGADVVYG